MSIRSRLRPLSILWFVAACPAQEVSIGLGSLILIGIIVMFSSSRNEKATLVPVLKKLDAIEKRLDAMDRRMEQPKVLAAEK